MRSCRFRAQFVWQFGCMNEGPRCVASGVLRSCPKTQLSCLPFERLWGCVCTVHMRARRAHRYAMRMVFFKNAKKTARGAGLGHLSRKYHGKYQTCVSSYNHESPVATRVLTTETGPICFQQKYLGHAPSIFDSKCNVPEADAMTPSRYKA